MPELPEVETIRAGLAPSVEGARIVRLELTRPDLRFPFPDALPDKLGGRTIQSLSRRAKYLLFALDDGSVLLSHLGMTGNYRLAATPPSRSGGDGRKSHDHLIMHLDKPGWRRVLIYSDPRRFGFIDWSAPGAQSPFLEGLGPEPLGNGLNAPGLAATLKGRRGPIKSALLDQRVIAGLGNIYVCEALWRAGIDPATSAGALVRADGRPSRKLENLTTQIRAVLADALAAGGSTLRDYRNAEGGTGYFQHSFDVYGREGEACRRPGCAGRIIRFTQAGRSSFACNSCQKQMS